MDMGKQDKLVPPAPKSNIKGNMEEGGWVRDQVISPV